MSIPANAHATVCKENEGELNTIQPVAIVGMGIRLPGDVRTSDEFWDLLMTKKDCSSEVPKTRYNVDAFYHPDHPQSVRTRRGYFLSDECLMKADPSFFPPTPGITVDDLDPQQVLLLEVVWECMENAGQKNWRGTDVGCYVGVFGEDWHEQRAKESQTISRTHAFANGAFALSNRLSYEFDLKGPSVTIHTACSSSLTALHEACQSLYSGSCRSAIVAGTNVLLDPSMTITMSQNGVLSPDGNCKVFDAGADGYARGEAVNAILIKPLHQAIADGDEIRAVIRSTSSNYDGKTSKIFAPDIESQERLIRDAYKRANIRDISETAFVECHGAGTKVGDFVEATAVAKVFQGKGVLIGSVKSNVGHGEGASGLTGVIKAVLSLEHSIIPPNMHFRAPNPRIPFKEGNLRVPVEPTPWPSDRKKRVSVNCFGIGGSNAHVILEAAPSAIPIAHGNRDSQKGAHLVPVSAQSQASLLTKLDDIKRYVESRPETISDVAYNLAVRRDHLSHRGYLLHDGEKMESHAHSTVPNTGKEPELVFLFTGQGAQWPGMGKDLFITFENFRHSIRAMDQILHGLESPPQWRLEDEIQSSVLSPMDKTEYSQTMCAAIQIALVNLFTSWGIEPSAVVGFSSGEVIAAYAANAISMRTAILIAYHRGLSLKHVSRDGGMAMVGLGRDEIAPFLVEGVYISCENSHDSVNISGQKRQLILICDRIVSEKPGTFVRQLEVDIAYHSPCIGEAARVFENSILSYANPLDEMIPLYSTTTGTVHLDPKTLDASHWRRNFESPVVFSTAIHTLLKERKSKARILFMEIGCHSTLSGPLRQIKSNSARSLDISYIPTILKLSSGPTCILKAVGDLFSSGSPINFTAICHGRPLTNLPTYPWDRKSLNWQESRLTNNWKFRKHSHHELLGSRTLEGTDLEPSWRNLISVSNVPWIKDHQLLGDTIFPCAGYVSMINDAIYQLFESPNCTIRNLHIKTPLVLPASGSNVEIITVLRNVRVNDRVDSYWLEFNISSYNGNEWTKHTVGQVLPDDEAPKANLKIPNTFPRSVSSTFWYDQLAKVGLQYGSSFQGMQDITADPLHLTASATICGKFTDNGNGNTLHPTAIDSCLQVLSVAATKGKASKLSGLAIPMFIDQICLRQPRNHLKVEATRSNISGAQDRGEIMLMSGEHLVLSMSGVTLARLDQNTQLKDSVVLLLSHCEWKQAIDFLPENLQIPLEIHPREIAHLIVKAGELLRGSLDTSDPLKDSTLPRHDSSHRHSDASNLVAQGQMQREHRNNLEWSHLINDLTAANLDFISDFHYLEATGQSSTLNNEQILQQRSEIYDRFEQWNSSIYDVSRWFSLLGHSNPRLRILETGAGKGFLSEKILQHLTEDDNLLCAKYTATDMTLANNHKLKEKLQKYDNVEFKSLDVQQDLDGQGFNDNSYDLIVASNIFTLTKPITALARLRKLIAPGGRLLLHEYGPGLLRMNDILKTQTPENSNFTKCFEDIERRDISDESWRDQLLQAGFSSVDVDTYKEKGALSLSRLMISRVSAEEHLPHRKVYLLCPDNTNTPSWVTQVDRFLVHNGLEPQRIFIGDEIPPKQQIISFLDLESPFFSHISETNWAYFQDLIRGSHQILWITRFVEFDCKDPDFSLVMGVSRTARQEQLIAFGTFQIDKFDHVATEALFQISKTFFKDPNQSGLMEMDYEFALYDQCIHIPRMKWSSLDDEFLREVSVESQKKIEIGTYGALDTVHWAEDSSPQTLSGDEVEVDVEFVGLNFRDVLITLGVMANKDELGVEASGTVHRCGPGVTQFRPGDRVMVMRPGLFRTRVVVNVNNCVLIPSTLSLEDAAAMPTIFATAVYCLLDTGRLESGQSVLIHAACGGVGLAAVQICQMIGAKIYATVGSEEKAAYLMKRHGISRDCIFSSRDTSFLPKLMAKTDGEGVDIVLNSLAGELLHASWKCVAEFGKMIEIGKRDFLEHGTLSLEEFGSNRSFFGVDLLRLSRKLDLLKRLISQSLNFYKEGKISPIRPLSVVKSADLVQGLRSLQRGLHMGKLIVKVPGRSDQSLVAKSRRHAEFSPDLSYILVGGLGGIGRAIAIWMTEQGARHLTFLSRSAGLSSQDQSFRQELEHMGCKVVMARADVTKINDVEDAIKASPCHIGGVLQLSMVIRDQFIPDMSHKNWQDAIAAKVDGTWNLHHALEGKDKYLQFFAVCGSVTGVMGNAGQINYSSANCFVSSFAQYRLQQGLPASVVNLGGVDDVGFLATQDPKLRERMRFASVRLLSEKEVLDAFEIAILDGGVESVQLPSNSQLPLTIPNNFIVGMSSKKSLADPTVRSLWGQDARFRAYGCFDSKQDRSSDLVKGSLTFGQMISVMERNPELLDDPEQESDTLRQIVKNVQEYSNFAPGLDYSQVAALPIDSLMTVEIRNWSRRYLDLELPLAGIVKSGTIEGLGKLMIDVLRSKYQKTE